MFCSRQYGIVWKPGSAETGRSVWNLRHLLSPSVCVKQTIKTPSLSSKQQLSVCRWLQTHTHTPSLSAYCPSCAGDVSSLGSWCRIKRPKRFWDGCELLLLPRVTHLLTPSWCHCLREAGRVKSPHGFTVSVSWTEALRRFSCSFPSEKLLDLFLAFIFGVKNWPLHLNKVRSRSLLLMLMSIFYFCILGCRSLQTAEK